jgi:hypothetical protein
MTLLFPCRRWQFEPPRARRRPIPKNGPFVARPVASRFIRRTGMRDYQ